MADVDWSAPCYDTVSWKKAVKPDSRLIYRIDEGSWVLSLVAGALTAAVGTALGPWIERKAAEVRENLNENGEAAGEEIKQLFPFVNYADIFVGHRYSGAEEKLTEVGKVLAEYANVENDRSVYDMDHVSGVSANEFFQTLEFLVKTNTMLNDEGPKKILSNSSKTTDFGGHLIAIGGPISNHYTRNLMYGDSIELPYRYDLNPSDGTPDLGQLSPSELRSVGVDDDLNLETRPNWRLVERDGSDLEIGHTPAEPERGRHGEQWIRDYFTIIKAPNIHPDGTAAYGTKPKVLSVSGCHGLGTRAAIHAIQRPDTLKRLEAEAKDGHFQAVGRVKRSADNDLEDAELLISDVQVL